MLIFCRSHLKHQTNQCHEEEKNCMLTQQGVGVGTAFYDGDSAVQSEVQVAGEEEHNDYDGSCSNDSTMLPSEESLSSDNSGSCPALY